MMAIIKLLALIWVHLLLMATAVDASEGRPQLQEAIDQFFKGNIQDSLPVFEQLADRDNPEAHYYLGVIYTNKQSKYYAIEKGMAHISSAINLGHSQAMFHMGMMYDNGIGVERNALEANDWYRRSRASEKLGDAVVTHYKEKNNSLQEVEYSELFEELLSQAAAGHAEVQFQVARIFDDGKLVPRDFGKAIYWYKKAADNGYGEAQFTMGYFYCRGEGVKKDNKVANEWLIKSNRPDRCID